MVAACRYCGSPLGPARPGFVPAVVVCGGCGLQWFVETVPTEAGPAGRAARVQDPRRPAPQFDREARWALGPERPVPGTKALDVGSAEGTWLAALERAGLEAWGLEPDPELCALASGRGLHMLPGYFSRAGLPPELAAKRYDLVSFRESIYYMSDLKETFALLRELLLPGGRLYLKCALADSPFFDSCRDYSARYGRFAQFMPNLDALKSLLAREGFSVADWRYMEWPALDALGGSPPARAVRRLAARLLAKSPVPRADRCAVVARLEAR